MSLKYNCCRQLSICRTCKGNHPGAWCDAGHPVTTHYILVTSLSTIVSIHIGGQYSASFTLLSGRNFSCEAKHRALVSDYRKYVLLHQKVFQEYPCEGISLGCKGEPFAKLPFTTFVASLIGMLIKTDSIHDLPWPPGESINNYMGLEAFRCFCASFDQAVNMLMNQGLGVFSNKLDFKEILVRLEG